METIRRSLNNPPITITRSDNSSPTIEGMALVYYNGTPDTEYEIKPNVFERIKRGAVQLDNDVILTYNHADLIARTPDTLKLNDTFYGIQFVAELDDTQDSKDLQTRIARKKIKGCSFEATTEKGDLEISREGDKTIVQINRMKLNEVSAVVRPAYTGTSVIMRAVDEFNAQQVEFLLRKKKFDDLKTR